MGMRKDENEEKMGREMGVKVGGVRGEWPENGRGSSLLRQRRWSES